MSKSRGFTTFSLHKRGFTLVELLVTITIIAILSAVGLVTYSLVMKQGQDSKRQSDLRAIQSALEQYYHDQGFYPYERNWYGSGYDLLGLDGLLGNSPSDPFTNAIGIYFGPPATNKTYMNSLPQDPTGTTFPYRYQAIPYQCENNSFTGNYCTSYCLSAYLEIPPSPAISLPTGCIWPAVSGKTYNFAVTPP